MLVVGVTAFLLTADRGPSDPTEGFTPAAILGRPVEGWAPGVFIVVIAVVSIVGLLKLRAASQLIRHSLRAQPGADLVSA